MGSKNGYSFPFSANLFLGRKALPKELHSFLAQVLSLERKCWGIKKHPQKTFCILHCFTTSSFSAETFSYVGLRPTTPQAL